MQGDVFRTTTIEEDLRLGFKFGFQGVVEYRGSMGKITNTTSQDTVCKNEST